MSYQISRADQQSRAMAQLGELQDYERVRFLRWLADEASDGTVKLTPWETQFVDSFFAEVASLPGVRVITFSPKQREVVDGLRRQHPKSV